MKHTLVLKQHRLKRMTRRARIWRRHRPFNFKLPVHWYFQT